MGVQAALFRAPHLAIAGSRQSMASEGMKHACRRVDTHQQPLAVGSSAGPPARRRHKRAALAHPPHTLPSSPPLPASRSLHRSQTMQALAAAAAGPALRPAATAAAGGTRRQRCLRVAADKGFSGGQGQRLPKQVKVGACGQWSDAGMAAAQLPGAPAAEPLLSGHAATAASGRAAAPWARLLPRTCGLQLGEGGLALPRA